jgi:hypothetical protein
VKRFGLVSILMAGALAEGISAAPLDKEACEDLKKEQARIEAAGARAHLAKGPAWAKANLSADKVQLVGRLIEIEEGLSFRCGLARTPLVKEAAAKPEPDDVDDTAPAATPPAKPKRRETPKKPGAAAPAVETAPAVTAAPGGADPGRKAARAARPKVDDALTVQGKAPSTLEDQARSLTQPAR